MAYLSGLSTTPTFSDQDPNPKALRSILVPKQISTLLSVRAGSYHIPFSGTVFWAQDPTTIKLSTLTQGYGMSFRILHNTLKAHVTRLLRDGLRRRSLRDSVLSYSLGLQLVKSLPSQVVKSRSYCLCGCF